MQTPHAHFPAWYRECDIHHGQAYVGKVGMLFAAAVSFRPEVSRGSAQQPAKEEEARQNRVEAEDTLPPVRWRCIRSDIRMGKCCKSICKAPTGYIAIFLEMCCQIPTPRLPRGTKSENRESSAKASDMSGT